MLEKGPHLISAAYYSNPLILLIWFLEQRWNGKPACPHCGSENVQPGAKRFSVKTGTVMQSSNLGYQVWAIVIYLMATSLKSVSGMKLPRDLDITQKSAWHLAHRWHQSFTSGNPMPMSGSCGVDESYFSGKVRNMSNAKRKSFEGRGAVDKTAVVGTKDRDTKQLRAKVVEQTDVDTLQGFIAMHADAGAKVYTDDASAYRGLPFDHETVKHSVSEYVRDQVHTKGIESFWSTLKRAHKGTFHKISPKYLGRYVEEFAGRQNVREMDTEEQMALITQRIQGKRHKYQDLIA